VNALSEWCEVREKRDGKVYFQRYERGIPIEPVKTIGKCDPDETGTTTTFRFDEQIFEKDITYRFDTLAQRFAKWRFVTKQVEIRLVDNRSEFPRRTTFIF
jgi:DNA gyrase subunit B